MCRVPVLHTVPTGTTVAMADRRSLHGVVCLVATA